MVQVEMELESVATPENAEHPKRKVDKTILDNFSKLVNPHEHVRVKSGANIVKYLFENSESGSVSLSFFQYIFTLSMGNIIFLGLQ